MSKLNPTASEYDLREAVRAVTNVESSSLVAANEKVHQLLTAGVVLRSDNDSRNVRQSIRYIDFQNPNNNDLLVVPQYPIRVSKDLIYLDIVIFINGIPIVTIECKDPTSGADWSTTAIDQMLRYQTLGGGIEDLGVQRLFETVQIVAIISGKTSLYGAVGTPARLFSEWRDPYPLTSSQIQDKLGRHPDARDLLIFGLLSPATLLDVLQNFIISDSASISGIRRHICRSHQFVAVHRALDRVRKRDGSASRGGIIWHAQGSGTTLTMLWLAITLRREPALENPKIVVIADRVDLLAQISSVFQHYGAVHQQADSASHLRTLLSSQGGGLILTTIQKFHTTNSAFDEPPTVLSDASNVCVIIAEAHRGQQGQLATSMRRSLPNALFFGFTGTPIERGDQSTLQVFGDYIDTYALEDAVSDGSVLPVYFESRLPSFQLADSSWDTDTPISEDTPDHERGVPLKRAIASSRWRIESIARDIVKHYSSTIQPNGFKAQIVAVSREAAITYKSILDKSIDVESAVIISGNANDSMDFARHRMSKSQRENVLRRFRDPSDPLAFLIVCNMLITGFDAPIEQVMYIDAPLKGPTLLQALARVNRPAAGKTHGLIVDYWGIADALRAALTIYSSAAVQDVIDGTVDEFPRLRERHAALMRFFLDVSDRNDIDKCADMVEPRPIRSEFELALRRFSQSLEIMALDSRALAYAEDLHWFGEIQKTLIVRLRKEIHQPSPEKEHNPASGSLERILREELTSADIEVGTSQEEASLVSAITSLLQTYTAVVDWTQRDEIQRQMRSVIKRHLLAAGASSQSALQLASRVVQLAKSGWNVSNGQKT